MDWDCTRRFRIDCSWRIQAKRDNPLAHPLNRDGVILGRLIDPPERYATRNTEDGTQTIYVTVAPDDTGYISFKTGHRIPGALGYIEDSDGYKSHEEPVETILRMSPYGWKYVNPIPLDLDEDDDTDGESYPPQEYWSY